MSFQRIRRLAVKLFGNIKSVVFHLIYFVVEVPWNSYNRYLKKRNLKNLRIQFPIINSVSFNHVDFLIYLEKKGIIEEMILREGSYEGELLKVADRFIREKTIIIDVGANIGFESLYFSKKYPDNLVLSYEPTSFAYGCLIRSKQINDLGNLKIYKMGVGAAQGKVEIHSPTHATYNKGLASIGKNFDIDDTFVKETIDMVCLDEHVQHDLRVSFIKIDVQGYEENVLKGAIKLIEKDRPVVVFEQNDRYHTSALEVRRNIESIFSCRNYELYLIRCGNTLRPYSLLEKINFTSDKEINGDVIAVPIDSAIESP